MYTSKHTLQHTCTSKRTLHYIHKHTHIRTQTQSYTHTHTPLVFFLCLPLCVCLSLSSIDLGLIYGITLATFKQKCFIKNHLLVYKKKWFCQKFLFFFVFFLWFTEHFFFVFLFPVEMLFRIKSHIDWWEPLLSFTLLYFQYHMVAINKMVSH